MKHTKKTTLFLVLILALFLTCAYSGEDKEISKTFKAKQLVKISTITSDCEVIKGESGEIKVHLVYDDPAGMFKPIMEEKDDMLLLREKIPAAGGSLWKVTVPDNTEIDFTSATGNFDIKGLKSDITTAIASGEISAHGCRGKLKIKNASGQVEVTDHKGEVDINIASGDLKIEKISGEIRIKALSGNIEAEDIAGSIDLKFTSGDIEIKNARAAIEAFCVSGDIEISDVFFKDASNFKTVSGDIYIKLSKTPDHDLTLSSASGNAVLNYNGNPIKGSFEFRARADVGKILSPFKFDKEEETYEYGKKYMIKSFKKGAAPKIILKTASGKAVLEK
jgi:DUF4097 and DUF4098 domain-containing protein YvlB